VPTTCLTRRFRVRVRELATHLDGRRPRRSRGRRHHRRGQGRRGGGARAPPLPRAGRRLRRRRRGGPRGARVRGGGEGHRVHLGRARPGERRRRRRGALLLIRGGAALLVAEALALHGARVPDEHRVPGPGQPRGGPPGGRRRRGHAAVAAHVGHRHGPPRAAPRRAPRGRHGPAPRRALPGRVPRLGAPRALAHGRGRHGRGGHPGGHRQRHRHQDPQQGVPAALGRRRHHRLGLVSSELSSLCSAWFQFLMAIGTESKYTSERLEIFSLEKILF
jgi:hypothetical protein